jgi:hypothetical protein
MHSTLLEVLVGKKAKDKDVAATFLQVYSPDIE